MVMYSLSSLAIKGLLLKRHLLFGKSFRNNWVSDYDTSDISSLSRPPEHEGKRLIYNIYA